MERIETSLPGVYELGSVVHRDSRGALLATCHRAKFPDPGINDTFLVDNHPISSRRTLPGLHYQLKHAQAKLRHVIEGEAVDVAVTLSERDAKNPKLAELQQKFLPRYSPQ